MRVCGVIVAGGRSSRMGSEKAFQTVGGRRILDRILASVGSQVDAVVINANGDVIRFGAVGIHVIPDIHPDAGTPLAGLHAALHFAASQDFDAALTVPSDTPFLPSNLVARLASSWRGAAIVSSGGQAHYLTGLWASGLRAAAESAVLQGRPARLQDWARQCEAAVVDWAVEPYDPFFNVNTPDDLAEAERIAAEFSL